MKYFFWRYSVSKPTKGDPNSPLSENRLSNSALHEPIDTFFSSNSFKIYTSKMKTIVKAIDVVTDNIIDVLHDSRIATCASDLETPNL